MPSERNLRKFVRRWRRRYPYPHPWVDDRANKQCRRSEDLWLARLDGSSVLKRKDVRALALWVVEGREAELGQAVGAMASPGEWGHARRRIKAALAVASPTQALACLLGDEGGVPGWGPAMASSVLAACRPDLFAVADPRALRSLQALELYRPEVEGEFVRPDWWPYLRISRRLAHLSGLSLRDVSRALRAAADDAPSLPRASKPLGRDSHG